METQCTLTPEYTHLFKSAFQNVDIFVQWRIGIHNLYITYVIHIDIT